NIAIPNNNAVSQKKGIKRLGLKRRKSVHISFGSDNFTLINRHSVARTPSCYFVITKAFLLWAQVSYPFPVRNGQAHFFEVVKPCKNQVYGCASYGWWYVSIRYDITVIVST